MCSEPVLGFVLGPIWASFRTNSVVVKLGSVGREVLVVVAVSGGTGGSGTVKSCKGWPQTSGKRQAQVAVEEIKRVADLREQRASAP